MDDKYELKQVSVRLVLTEAEPLYSSQPITDSQKAVDVMAKALSGMDREYCCVVNLDAQRHPINYNIVSIGDTSQTQIPIQNLFKSAILSNAVSTICLHNHPSGSLTPSQADLTVTRRMVEAGRMIGIPVIDHIIVAGGSGLHNSIRDSNPEAFRLRFEDRTEFVAEEQSVPYTEKSTSKMNEILEKLHKGVEDIWQSGKFESYLKTMSRFHNYSTNNQILILLQNPEATYCAGFCAWRDRFQRTVRKGETGIRILAPAPKKVYRDVEKIDPKTQKPYVDKDGKPIKERVQQIIPAYKIETVFDIAQTEGKELPKLITDLKADVKDYEHFMEALKEASPVPIELRHISGSSHGYYHLEKKEIAIREDMSQEQTVKTCIHEISHALLHDRDLGKEKEKSLDRHTQEVEAESVAFVVCQHFGIDSSDYSFGYICGWSKGRELDELKSSMDTIRSTASDIINSIEKSLYRAREQSKEQVQGRVKTTELPKLAKTESSAKAYDKPRQKVHSRCH